MTKSAIQSSGSVSCASYSDGDLADSHGGSAGSGTDYSVASEEFNAERRKKPVKGDGIIRKKFAPIVSRR